MNGDRDPFAGLRAVRPPSALRERVLAAARDVATQPAQGLLEALYRDRLLRSCAAGLTALVIANALVAGGKAPTTIATPAAVVNDGLRLPDDTGLTAAEQIDALQPVLGDAIPRSRG